ncbi:MAG: hypothetical protein SFX73_15125 [Kofleriaceae bacterium]|nr:hypothetical protein [Kofleriaceae bacterium]
MQHDARTTHRPGAVTAVDGPCAEASAGALVGKRSHTDALEPVAASTVGVAHGLGAGSRASVAQVPSVAAPGRPGGPLPRLDLRPTPPGPATLSPREGHGAGWGVDSMIAGITSAVRSATKAVAGAVSSLVRTPVITHETTSPAPNADNNRTTVGVGEYVTFTSNMPGTWKADRAGPTSPKKMRGEFFVWGAMYTKGTATITFIPDDREKRSVEITLTVIEPDVDYLNARARAFPGQAAGVAGVMMETDVTFGPGTVSFANTDWLEKGNPATAATGYFKDLVENGGKLPYHRPNPKPMGIDENNTGVPDQAGFWDFAGPFTAGSFEWVIPTYYRVREGGQKHKIKDVVQTCTIGPDGTMTVSKGSSRRSRTP